MRIEASILTKEIEEKFSELVVLVEALKKHVVNDGVNTSELVDTAFTAREVVKHLDEFKKRVNELSRSAQASCCIAMAVTGQDIVRTDYCSATTNPKPWYKIPYKREQDQFQWDEIMRGLGVNPNSAGNQKGIIRLHAPELMTYCGELTSEGKQPPAGIDPKQSTGMELNLRITQRNRTA
jgi:hypothetical protein